MATFVARRLLGLVPLLLLISFGVFLLITLLPGDPARAIAGGTDAQPEEIERVREELHLDDPLLSQYWRWLTGAVTGDLGDSLFDGRSVASEIAQRFPVTVSLVLGGVAFSLLVGIPLGLVAGIRPGTWVDRAATTTSSVGIAMPDFWLAMVLVVVFAVNGVDLGFAEIKLPSIGYTDFGEDPVEWARHLVMPWIAIGFAGAASLARQLRGALVDAMNEDYVRTARAKGLRNSVVVGKHALKNAATPVITILGIQIAYALGGTVIIEQIFAIPGMGSYAFQAVLNRDLPVIQGVVLLSALVFVAINLVVDVVYGLVNPKVRLS